MEAPPLAPRFHGRVFVAAPPLMKLCEGEESERS